MPILVFEGVNCCGKTTVAQKLASHTGLEYVKFSIPPVEQTFDHFWDGLVTAHRRNSNFILDRCHLSNAVYGDFLGGGTMNPSEWNIIDMWLAEQDAWLFLMTDDVFHSEARMIQRNRDIDREITNRPQIAMLQRRFEQAFARSVIPTKGQFTLRQFLTETDQTTEQYRDLVRAVTEKIERP